MSSVAAFTVIEAYLRAAWTDTPLAFENETWPLTDDPGAFVYVEITADLLAQETVGSPGANLWREVGEVRCYVLVPNGTGSTAARTIAGDLAALFREVEIDGVQFGDLSIGAADAGETDGNYWRMGVVANWWRDDITGA